MANYILSLAPTQFDSTSDIIEQGVILDKNDNTKVAGVLIYVVNSQTPQNPVTNLTANNFICISTTVTPIFNPSQQNGTNGFYLFNYTPSVPFTTDLSIMVNPSVGNNTSNELHIMYNKAFAASNDVLTATFPITINNPGSYTVNTNTIDGMNFSLTTPLQLSIINTPDPTTSTITSSFPKPYLAHIMPSTGSLPVNITLNLTGTGTTSPCNLELSLSQNSADNPPSQS